MSLGISPGLLYYDEDVKKLFTDNGYVNLPIQIGRVNCTDHRALATGNIGALVTTTYYCSYFLRSNTIGFTTNNPTVAGNAVPYFFGESKLVIEVVTGPVQPVSIAVYERTFARYRGDGTTSDGVGLEEHGTVYDFMKSDRIEFVSRGNNTRYWEFTITTGAGASANFGFRSLWNGVGGIERYTP